LPTGVLFTALYPLITSQKERGDLPAWEAGDFIDEMQHLPEGEGRFAGRSRCCQHSARHPKFGTGYTRCTGKIPFFTSGFATVLSFR